MATPQTSPALIGSAALVKNGTGLFVLSGANGYSTTTINAGALEAATTASIPGVYPPNPAQISIAPGALLAVGMGGPQQWTTAQIGTLLGSSLFSNGGTLGIDTSGGNAAYSGNLSGSGLGLDKFGSNTLMLSGSNTYGGATIVSGGALEAASTAALPASSLSNVNVMPGATLTLAVGGPQGWTASNIANVLSIAHFSPGANLGIDTSGGTFSLGVLGSSTIGLVLTGTNRLTLTASNGYTGATTISQGTLQLANSAALVNSTVAINADNGLQFSPGIGTFYLGGLSGENLLKIADTSGGSMALAVGGSADSTCGGQIIGSGSLRKIGAGTLVLGGSNTYSGGTFVADGTLEITNAAAILDGTDLTIGDTLSLAAVVPGMSSSNQPIVASPDTVAVPEPNTLSLFASAVILTIAYYRRRRAAKTANIHCMRRGIFGLMFASDAALGAPANPIFFYSSGTLHADCSVTLSSSRTITIGLGATGTLDPGGGTLTIDAAIDGNGALAVSRSGLLVLANPHNSYAGGTYVFNGTLEIADPGAIKDGTDLHVGFAWMFESVAHGATEAPYAVIPGAVAMPEPESLTLLAAIALFTAFSACVQCMRNGSKGTSVYG